MPLLTFQCRHRYPDGFILDAEFQAGSGVTALVGPSGSGKSTILAVIAGILRADHAVVRLAGRTLADSSSKTFIPPERRRIGIVFQDRLLFPHLSVLANLHYGLKRQHLDDQAANTSRLLKILDLTDMLHRRPSTLSGGEKQRVALGRALLSGPKLLLLDEPLVGLDAPAKDRILTYLERILAEWHIPTLLVSHDQSDVNRLAEQIVTISNGRAFNTKN